jgi:hypothetical protein
MALTFTTPIELGGGITIENAYGRVTAIDAQKGDQVMGTVHVYATEQAFLDGKEALGALPFRDSAWGPYDRTVDGVDILDLAHDVLIGGLAQQGYVATKSL